MKKIGVIEIWMDEGGKTPNYPALESAEVADALWSVLVASLKNLPAALYGVVEAYRVDAAQVLGAPEGTTSVAKAMLEVKADFDTAGVDSVTTPAKTRTWQVTWDPTPARYVLPPDV